MPLIHKPAPCSNFLNFSNYNYIPITPGLLFKKKLNKGYLPCTYLHGHECMEQTTKPLLPLNKCNAMHIELRLVEADPNATMYFCK